MQGKERTSCFYGKVKRAESERKSEVECRAEQAIKLLSTKLPEPEPCSLGKDPASLKQKARLMSGCQDSTGVAKTSLSHVISHQSRASGQCYSTLR